MKKQRLSVSFRPKINWFRIRWDLDQSKYDMPMVKYVRVGPVVVEYFT